MPSCRDEETKVQKSKTAMHTIQGRRVFPTDAHLWAIAAPVQPAWTGSMSPSLCALSVCLLLISFSEVWQLTSSLTRSVCVLVIVWCNSLFTHVSLSFSAKAAVYGITDCHTSMTDGFNINQCMSHHITRRKQLKYRELQGHPREPWCLCCGAHSSASWYLYSGLFPRNPRKAITSSYT